MQELSLYILDLVNNSITANATKIDIEVSASSSDNLLTLSITDNGCGMSQDMVDRLADPYTTTRTTRDVGMGIPFFVELCNNCLGTFHVSSQLGEGTTIVGTMQLSSIDLLPMGDIVSTIITLITSRESIDYTFVWAVDEDRYQFDTMVIRQVLEGIPLDNSEVISVIRQELIDNTQSLQEKLYEITQRASSYQRQIAINNG